MVIKSHFHMNQSEILKAHFLRKIVELKVIFWWFCEFDFTLLSIKISLPFIITVLWRLWFLWTVHLLQFVGMNCKSPDPKRWRRRRELDRFLKNEWKIIPIDSSLCWIWTRYKGRQRWKSLIMAAWFPVFDGWLQSNFCLFNLPFVTTYISAYLLLKTV